MRSSDWSSDVCSADRLAVLAVILVPLFLILGSWWQQIVRDLVEAPRVNRANYLVVLLISLVVWLILLEAGRSEERCVGRECVSTSRSGWSPDHNTTKPCE